ncbi:MAG: hypothetical protein ABI624_14000 [Casimicrobiaceae bacterium]
MTGGAPTADWRTAGVPPLSNCDVVAALAFVLGTAASVQDMLKLAAGQRGNWDTAISEMCMRSGICNKHAIAVEILRTQGAGETQQAVIAAASLRYSRRLRTWLCPGPVQAVRARLPDRLLVLGQGRVSIVQRAAHGRTGNPTAGSVIAGSVARLDLRRPTGN